MSIRVAFVLAVLLAAPNPSFAFDGELTPISKVPPEIKKTAESAAPNADLKIAFKFTNTDKFVWWRLGGQDADKGLVAVKVTGDGNLMDVRFTVALDAVPKKVKKALKEEKPDFKPKDEVEVLGQTTETPLLYAFEGEEDGEDFAVGFTPEGKKVPFYGQILLTPADLPKTIRKAADQTAPGTKWHIAFESNPDDYCLFGKTPKGQYVEFEKSGKGQAVFIDIPLEEVPEVVTTGLKAKMADFEPKAVQAFGRRADDITGYRFQGKGFQNRDNGVYVGADGKQVNPMKD